MVFLAVLCRLAYQALTGPSPSGDALKAMWAFTGAAIAAAVTLTGLLFSRAQVERTERRLVLDTTVEGLKLLTMPGGEKVTRRVQPSPVR